MAAEGCSPGAQGRPTWRAGRQCAELDYVIASNDVAWAWGIEVNWTAESDHTWLSSRPQRNKAEGRACTPAKLNNLPREALADLRIKYRAFAAVLGVEEPHALSSEWRHDQPRQE